ncbi:hypothetical protein ccbrp13_29120 [Ktedonobacteria bacterium brp13]|nr:hypothetical protein ccbrp13_29120 [Ktedonobacteria bacterium brp13]
MSLTASGVITYTGTIQDNTLSIETTDATGQSVQQKWNAISRSDYNRLATAFTSYNQLAVVSATMDNDLQNMPSDSTSSVADNDVHIAQTAVQDTQNAIDDFNTSYYGFGCNFGSLIPGSGQNTRDPFQIPITDQPTFQTLNDDLNQLQQQWSVTQKVDVAQLNGIPLPWRAAAAAKKQISLDEDAVKAQKSSMKMKISNDQKQITGFKAQFAALTPQYTQDVKKYCNN